MADIECTTVTRTTVEQRIEIEGLSGGSTFASHADVLALGQKTVPEGKVFYGVIVIEGRLEDE